MNDNIKRVLIISGEFGLMSTARDALTHSHFLIQTAYSHNDGVYALANGEFDIVIVDAHLTSFRSGESALVALTEVNQSIPIIGLASDLASVTNEELSDSASIIIPTPSTILHAVSKALGLPLASIDSVDQYPLKSDSVSPVADASPVSNSSEEIQTLFALSKSLTEVLDLSEVLNRVVEAARRLTNAEEGMILLPDEEGGQLFLRAKVGIDVEVARNFRVKTEDTLAGRVYGSGQPILIGAQGPQKVKTEYLVNALLYVPILYEGRCIGVLGVNNKNTEAIFDPKHLDLLINLASFAAIAIENARIHEEALTRTRELQGLVEASQILNSSLSLEKTLPNVCEQLMRVVNVNLAAIYDWDREKNRLNLLTRCFKLVWATGHGPVIDLTRRLVVQRALENNTSPVIALSDPALPTGELDALKRNGVHTIQVVPIVGGEQVLGVILFSFTQSPETLPTTETVHRIQLMTLEVLAMLSSQSNFSRPQGMFRVLENALALTGADWCEVALLNPDRTSLIIQLAFGQGVWSVAPHPFIDLTNQDDLIEAIRSQTIINRQTEMTPGIRSLIESTGCRSAVGLPLVQRGQGQGIVLFADSRRSRVFTERDIDMGRAVVAQAATALANAQLVHDLEKSLIELKETQDRLVQTARLSAMGELAAAVAHQINNPLTTIMVDSEMMLLDENPDSPNYRSLQAIHRAGKRASGVARRLLAISRPNDPESSPEKIDVVDTIQGVLSLVKAHIERDHIEIVSEMPDDPLPPTWAAPGLIDDIWLNLLLNAHDALIGREGAKLGIRASYLEGEDYLQVQVWDNGPGIPENIINDVFKPFFTTKPVGEGTGLGLHICRQTTERIGGSIRVESKPNEGARFFVLLPVKRGGTEL